MLIRVDEFLADMTCMQSAATVKHNKNFVETVMSQFFFCWCDVQVYGWGYNGNGQLGLGNNVNQMNPCRVPNFQGIVITKVVCGYAHTMALSDVGALYVWGANSYGQLGNGNRSTVTTPVHVASEIGRFVVLNIFVVQLFSFEGQEFVLF